MTVRIVSIDHYLQYVEAEADSEALRLQRAATSHPYRNARQGDGRRHYDMEEVIGSNPEPQIAQRSESRYSLDFVYH
jgi:hypothetical protein